MRNFKVGDKVNYHSIIGLGVTSECHEITAVDDDPKNNFGGPVAWLTDKSGCVSFDALSKYICN